MAEKKQKNKSSKVLTLLARKGVMTDKEIAKDVGCTVSLVNKVRNSSGRGNNPVPRSDDWVADFAYRMSKDGTATSVNTAGVDPNAWTRSGILNQAEQYVTKDRAADHGDMEDNFRTIADLWTAYLGFDLIITDRDVAAMMTLLKIARSRSNPDNADNWIDACGYMACGGELATQKDHK
tara:strand:+ start:5951 stop:6487 length:537 start_codon:yes stop_codon:yes gene_type:complete